MEPEILAEGKHKLERCQEVTEKVICFLIADTGNITRPLYKFYGAVSQEIISLRQSTTL